MIKIFLPDWGGDNLMLGSTSRDSSTEDLLDTKCRDHCLATRIEPSLGGTAWWWASPWRDPAGSPSGPRSRPWSGDSSSWPGSCPAGCSYSVRLRTKHSYLVINLGLIVVLVTSDPSRPWQSRKSLLNPPWWLWARGCGCPRSCPGCCWGGGGRGPAWDVFTGVYQTPDSS